MKYISLILIIILGLTGCQADPGTDTEGKIEIVASLFPQYDFARIVGGDEVTVTLLLPPGVEAHGYEPTPKEVVAIQAADLFLYTGEVMEPWAHRLVDGSSEVNPLDLSQSIHLIEEADHADHEDEEEHDDHDHDHDHGGIDPHIWTDPMNASAMVEAIREALSRIAPDKADTFRQNAERYQQELKQLDQDFKDLFGDGEHDIFFAGHNAFGYFAQRYGLHFHTPYAGFAPDAEPSPKAITELMDKMSQAGSSVIYYEELIEPKVAEVIQAATGAKMLLLNGAHNVSKEDLAGGIGYLDIMRQNLAALQEGLE